MSRRRHTVSLRLVALAATATGALTAAAALPLASSADQSVSKLQGELSQQRATQQGLSASVSGLSQSLGVLESQITLVASREGALLTDLQHDRTALTQIEGQFASEEQLVAVLRRRLARARKLLARQVVSRYESDHPDLVGVVIDAHGFTDLLERLDFLHRAEVQQQNIIKRTQTAKAQADSAERRLVMLEAEDSQVTASASVRARALAAMNSLLEAKQGELSRARAAQQVALQASQAKGRQLQSAIARATAEQAARQAAASAVAAREAAASAAAAREAAATASSAKDATQPAKAGGDSDSSTGSSVAAGPALLPSDGWAIPYSVVLCESGGQNLPPNGAGASGYYQIVASTWEQYGGQGAAAYLASKSEQDAVASRIWARGTGASNWVCATVIGER
jgi:septal ring factor EnvC (AmiA/AmiB activator)